MRSIGWRLAAAALAAVLGASSVGAQDKETAPATKAPSLHAAWLVEILDLDLPRATTLYRAVADDTRPGHLERWLAWARLAELHRLGVPVTALPTPGDVPAPLRASFSAAEPLLDMSELSQRTRGEPRTVLQNLASEAGRLPRLRPIVSEAADWLQRQVGPSLRDQIRQGQQRQPGASNLRISDPSGAFSRLNSNDVLGAELQGRTGQADALRALYFAEWRAPETPGDAGTWVERARSNLKAWLAEELGQQQRGLLEELGQAIDRLAPGNPGGERQASGDAAAVLALLKRLPGVAERLLTTAESGGVKEKGASEQTPR